jgi:hypothetical protein
MFGFLALVLAWKFVAPDAQQVVAMEWKRVLDSPLSAAVRREIPSSATPALANINFIEGIERVIWTPELLVLEGSFDLLHLREMALADGGVSRTYNKVEVLGPSEGEGARVGLVSESLVLLGQEDAVKRAIDRGDNSKISGPSGYDLWVRTTGPDLLRHDFGVRIANGVDVTSRLRYRSEDAAQTAVDRAAVFGMTGSRNGAEVALSGQFTREEFTKRPWRSALETLQTAESVSRPKQPSKPGVIRIYGLDEGVKEIPLK